MPSTFDVESGRDMADHGECALCPHEVVSKDKPPYKHPDGRLVGPTCFKMICKDDPEEARVLLDACPGSFPKSQKIVLEYPSYM